MGSKGQPCRKLRSMTTDRLLRHLAEMGTELRRLIAADLASARQHHRHETLAQVVKREARIEDLTARIEQHHGELLRRSR